MSSFKLAQWRKARGHSLAQLARLSGLSDVEIEELETGRRQYDQRALEGLSSALDCTPAELFSDPPIQQNTPVEPWRHPHSEAGHFLREWRTDRGLTLEELAARADMSHGNISRLERGLVPYSQHSFEMLAAALGTDPASLILMTPADAEAFRTFAALAPARRRQLARIAEILADGPAEDRRVNVEEELPSEPKKTARSPPRRPVAKAQPQLSDVSKAKLERIQAFKRR